jgi:Mlc titration factor MtfA (ptsG expression regulator)
MVFFRWFRERRRRRWQRQAPDLQATTWLQRLWFHSRLSDVERQRLVDIAKILVAEKNWEGCGGLSMRDEIRWTIAAQIAWMLLGLEHDYFSHVPSILVYPDAYWAPEETATPGGVILAGEAALEGQAWHRGPVILSWRDVRRGARGRNHGRNVVLHEFAHQLDMLNGSIVDGVPPLRSAAQVQRWLDVVEREQRALAHRCELRLPTVLDCYGAEAREEFFAVATEAFFQTPRPLRQRHNELYEMLVNYFGQDPAAREDAADGRAA